ncbi:MAG TPA: pyridoxamine 5'-phosphate oxidase family protein [Rickettsiales bacterium]|nr:pyridoxamine 5'-phosphate oxidase family protein [Rickettsiales bacterium]
MLEIKQNTIKIINSCDEVQFCTYGLNNYPETRFIANYLNKNVTDFPLHFITHHNSHKIQQITSNPRSCLYYFNPKTRMAITLFGTAKEFSDQNTKDKFWNDNWKQYGFKDKNDNEYTIIEFTPKIYKFYTNGSIEHTGEF